MPYSVGMKIVIALAFVGIVAALFLAGRAMLHGSSEEEGHRKGRMARALTVRIGLSVALFVFILVAYKLGWIQPTGLPVGR
ncbi:twin transmembrane helix small protein [Caldimonas sp. KR1-144]|uniref:twin transmembrane helix small protein n=1 Tax=Caldimonas sp. KR1-144 TaxID=3400911 RepID=UPI003C022BEA